MKDSADPLDGWSSREGLNLADPATNDIYGRFYAYLYSILLRFCQTCSGLDIAVHLFQEDLRELPQVLGNSGQSQRGFDRIEVR